MSSINKTLFQLTLQGSQLFSFIIDGISELFYFVIAIYNTIGIVAAAKLLSHAGLNLSLTQNILVTLSKIILKGYGVIDNDLDLVIARIKEIGKIQLTFGNIHSIITGTHAQLHTQHILTVTNSFIVATSVLAQLYRLSAHDPLTLSAMDTQSLSDLDSTIL